MANFQLLPLEVNSATGEPFLRLRSHTNIIITPPRPTDLFDYIPLLNDPRVHETLIGPPVPYLLEHSQAWFNIVIKPIQETLAELEGAQGVKDLITVGDCPVRAIREIKKDGEEVYLGDIGISRFLEGKLLALPNREASEEERKEHEDLNSCRQVGDPDITWTIGYYLAPSHHGKGIMTDALETLLWDWAVPRMSVHHIRATAFQGNQGSVRVFEKNGFLMTSTWDDYVMHRGRMRGLHIMEWDKSKITSK